VSLLLERRTKGDSEQLVETERSSTAILQIDSGSSGIVSGVAESAERRAAAHVRGPSSRPPALRKHRFHVLNEELFRSALIRERKCADRSNRPFGLLLITLSEHENPTSAPLWKTAIEAVSTAQRETDVVGWFDRRAALGVILSDIHDSDPANVWEIENRIRRELSLRLSADAVARFTIRLHLHVDPKLPRADCFTVDPLITKLRSTEGRTTVNDRLKRLLDIVASSAMLLLLSPVFLLIAILVKLNSRGPVFFRQVRVGQAGKPFTMLKFRSMKVNAAESLHHDYVTQFIKASGQAQGTKGNQLFKIANDPRVTTIGRVLRKTSLDELPQLLNVAKGEMSLVGPRPPLQYEVDQYKAWHCRRVLEAKPGITGLWQVTGRSRTTFDEMVRLDLRYVRTSSLWTDVKILLATPRAVISGKGAC
jgi:exopolysaccharide biosynthesis polyprenyl glycosylphosphotransferase